MKSENQISEAEEILCKIAWRAAASGVARSEQMVSWGLGGVGAILGLLIANIDSITKIVSLGSLRGTIVLLAFSFLCGVVAKILTTALTTHLEVTLKVESLMGDTNFKSLVSIISESTKAEEILKKISEPFWGPLSKIFLISANRIAQDQLYGEKLRIKIYCLVSYLTWFQFALAVTGILVIACAI